MFTNTYVPHVGGVARSVLFFTQDLRKMDSDVLVITPEYENPQDEVPEHQENVMQVPAIQNFNGSDFSFRIPVPFVIDERLDEFEPDIIHSHHPFLLGDAALRAARRRGLPLVFTHHTLYEEYTHYVSQASEKMRQFAIHLSTEYANMCARVVAPSNSIADLIKERGVKQPVTVIPTGVDTAFFSKGRREEFRAEHRIPKEAFVVGHLGRLAPEKNLNYLAEAVSGALKSLPNSRFLVVGEGPSQDDIRRILEQEGISHRLVLAGKQTGDDLCDAYHAMDIFVFASHTETQGMVLTEAMAAGLPVIALDAPGVREVVTHEENGALLSSKAPVRHFAQAILESTRQPEVLTRWQRNARETAHLFGREQTGQMLFDLYDSVMAESMEYRAHSTDYSEPWERLRGGIQAEWELITEKAKAVVKTVADNIDG